MNVKVITFFLSLCFVSNAFAFATPDIVIESRLDADWSGILVSRLRRFMSNSKEPDVFRHKFKEPIVVTESNVGSFLNTEGKDLLTGIGKLLEMDFLNTQTTVTLHGFSYDILGFKTTVNTAENTRSGVSVDGEFSASRVVVAADRIVLSLAMPGKKSIPVIDIEITKPRITAFSDKLINLISSIELNKKNGSFFLSIKDVDLSTIAFALSNDIGNLQIKVGGIKVPELAVRVGNKTLNIDPKKIETLLKSKVDGLKNLLIAQFSSFLLGDVVDKKLADINNVSFSQEHWIETTDLQTQLKIESFEGTTHGKALRANMTGDFCTTGKYVDFGKNCTTHKTEKIKPSRINEKMHNASLDEMATAFDVGDANIIASISEDFINKAISTTIEAGMWDEMLRQSGAALGPNKIFVRLDEKNSSTATAYVDIVYKPKKVEAAVIGEKEVRFPLVLKVGLRIVSERRIPRFVIYMKGIDISDETLLKGKPEYGVVSNLSQVRLKKKVLSIIKEKLAPFQTMDEMVSLAYDKLRGLGLEKVDFKSDGFGRMNALLKLKDTSEVN